MVIDLDKGKYIYGQNCPEPVIIVKNITLDKSSIQIIGSNKDTLKFMFNNITYIKFKAKDLIEELNNNNNKISLTVVGKGNLNKWGGKVTPQIFIENIEINKINDIDF